MIYGIWKYRDIKKKDLVFEEKGILINTFFWYVILLQTEILVTRLDESWTHQSFQIYKSYNGAWWASLTFSEMSSGLVKLYCYISKQTFLLIMLIMA